MKNIKFNFLNVGELGRKVFLFIALVMTVLFFTSMKTEYIDDNKSKELSGLIIKQKKDEISFKYKGKVYKSRYDNNILLKSKIIDNSVNDLYNCLKSNPTLITYINDEGEVVFYDNEEEYYNENSLFDKEVLLYLSNNQAQPYKFINNTVAFYKAYYLGTPPPIQVSNLVNSDNYIWSSTMNTLPSDFDRHIRSMRIYKDGYINSKSVMKLHVFEQQNLQGQGLIFTVGIDIHGFVDQSFNNGGWPFNEWIDRIRSVKVESFIDIKSDLSIEGSQYITSGSNYIYKIDPYFYYGPVTWTVTGDLRIVSKTNESEIIVTPTVSSTNCGSGTISFRAERSILPLTKSQNIKINQSKVTSITGPTTLRLTDMSVGGIFTASPVLNSNCQYEWRTRLGGDVSPIGDGRTAGASFMEGGLFYVECRAISNCGSQENWISRKVTVLDMRSNFATYNSSTNQLLINEINEGKSDKYYYQITNISTGDISNKGYIQGKTNVINLYNLKKGIYVLSVYINEEDVRTLKFIKE